MSIREDSAVCMRDVNNYGSETVQTQAVFVGHIEYPSALSIFAQILSNSLNLKGKL